MRGAAWVPILMMSFLVVALPTPALEETDRSGRTDTITLSVAVDGMTDLAVLAPRDFRSPALRADDPNRVLGHYRGPLASGGGTLSLILRDDTGIGLLDQATGTRWVKVEEGIVVPIDDASTGPEGPGDYADDEVRSPAPRDPVDPAQNPTRDGVLQIALERDTPFVSRLGEDESSTYAFDVLFLAEAILDAQFGITFEVVHNWWWPSGDPYEETDDGSAFLRQIRDKWESILPTTSDPREVHHTFTARTMSGSVGYAYIRDIETSWAYGHHVLRNDYLAFWVRGLPHPMEAVTTAHELGHNLDALHSYATPSPAGLLDPLNPGDCTARKYGTIMFPCSVLQRLPRFSRGNPFEAVQDTIELTRDGGNEPRVRDYAASII